MQSILLRWLIRALAAAIMCVGAGPAAAAGPVTNSAAVLRARYADLLPQLSSNQFQRPLFLESTESTGRLKGEVYALVVHPFAAVSEALSGPAQWCDLLILHLNTKYCHSQTDRVGSVLTVGIGKKIYQELDDVYLVEFAFLAATRTTEYFDVSLNASNGPLGTSDYRILLEAVSLEGGKTFLHLTYSYAYGFAGRVAMQAYLATTGRGKVGFTRSGKQKGTQPDYLGGVRGVVERNVMRYYLAIDAYLGALSTAPADRFGKRLQHWFDLTEQYSRQLHEVDRISYLEMKHRELLRMQKSP